jgi:hypothetical protein
VPWGCADRVSLRIQSVAKSHQARLLPFPHGGAKTLEEATNTVVLWEVEDLLKCPRTDPNIEPPLQKLLPHDELPSGAASV